MKITKTKLIEAVEDPEKVIDDLGKPAVDVVDLDSADTDEIVADMARGAEEEDKFIELSDAEKEAEVVKQYADIIYNPYGTGNPGKIKKALQRSLETALRNKRSGIDADYPNVLIYGLAGFGKTSIVREFCREHNINMFSCDAKNLDAATVGGIPVPITKRNSETIQLPISSSYWDDLEYPCILFMDEINRSNGRVRGSLLGLINDHELPAAIEDKKTRRHKAVKKYPNILFTVIAINPSDDMFPDAEPLDPAMVSRNSAVLAQEPEKKELASHISSYFKKALQTSTTQPAPNVVEKKVEKIYGDILSDPSLSDADRAVREGQAEIADTILNNPICQFDDYDTIHTIFELQSDKGVMKNYLNYRTFLSTLLRSNGTKKDYLDVIKNESGFIDDDIQMITNCLADYTDKVTVGNNVWNGRSSGVSANDLTKSAHSANAKKINRNAMADLDAFANSH